MLIVGVDGAEYTLTRDYYPVSRLEQDAHTLHTVPSWATMFDRNGTRYERPDRYDTPVRAEYVWASERDDWTVANLPVSFPTHSFNCTVPRTLSKPKSADGRHRERLSMSSIIHEADTEHVLVVLNGLDAYSHVESDMGRVRDVYDRTFTWVDSHDPDVVLSDHGFSGFGEANGVADHSENAVVAGLDASKVTEVGPELAEKV